MLGVSTKVTALFKKPPLKHNPFTLPKHFFVGKTTAALERKGLQSLRLAPGAVRLGDPPRLPVDPYRIWFVLPGSHWLSKISSLRGN